jgi:hypothetical protein
VGVLGGPDSGLCPASGAAPLWAVAAFCANGTTDKISAITAVRKAKRRIQVLLKRIGRASVQLFDAIGKKSGWLFHEDWKKKPVARPYMKCCSRCGPRLEPKRNQLQKIRKNLHEP